MKHRVVVNGARGKMGQLACETLRGNPHFQLVASLGREDDLKSAIIATKPHIVIELTRADCVYRNSLVIIGQGVHPVIGASGLQPEEIDSLQHMCLEQNLGGVIAPNFSLAAVLMMQFSAMAARILKDVEIIEAHHPQKWDSPSGTAIKTAEMIAKARPSSHRAISGEARGAMVHGVNIHSVRLPGLLARQQVMFGQLGETLTITHDSIDRISFMPGVILACEKVLELKKLVYGLDEILNAQGRT